MLPSSAGTDVPAGDVIVLDDGEETTIPSPGRTSARIKAKKVARAPRTASRKPKRVGPVSATDLAEARRKKRKAGTAPSALEPPTQEMHPPLSSDLLDANPVSATTAPPVSTACSATLNSSCDGAPSGNVRVPPSTFAAPPLVSSAMQPCSGDGEQPRLRDVAVSTAETAGMPPLNPTVPASVAEPALPQASPFDLDDFRRSFQVPAYGAAPCTALVLNAQNASLEAKVNQLFDLFNDLRRAIQPPGSTAVSSNLPASMPPSAGTLPDRAEPVTTALDPSLGSTRAPFADAPGLWTLPTTSTGADMPSVAICQLRCSSFELHRSRVKGEYAPPQAHQLAAHRLFRDLISDAGKWWSPMSFVLHVRELDCVRFDAPPAVLMALYSGRLGSRGLTVMHFRPLAEAEQFRRGSTNANFSTDFGAGARCLRLTRRAQPTTRY
ncbi:hypothetical protein V7S43_000448 [Phytophthora oleae]|uniref:Uncharacterized protein n=1 Tax=Phytophthora oleae TaxID=2107226 RepID=A0ABD3G8Y9_9STRA